MSEAEPFDRAAFAAQVAVQSSVDEGYELDAKGQLAKALVLAGGAISDDAARCIEYLFWALGPELALPIVQRQLEIKMRQNTGFARYIVDGIKALATMENREASLFGVMGKGKE